MFIKRILVDLDGVLNEYGKEPYNENFIPKIKSCAKEFIQNLSELENPYLRGAPLTGGLSGYWKYRVGDYRLLCEIHDDKLLVLIVKIGHRREVYNG